MTYARNSSPIPIPRDSGSAPRVSGAKSHIFQPPRSTYSSSASSSLFLTRSINSTSTSSAVRPGPGARKRSRADSPREEEVWRSEQRCPESPVPFVNTKYVLAGGMDTPTMRAAQLAVQGDGGEDSYVGYRCGLEGARRGLFDDAEIPGYDGRQGNGRPPGWGSPNTEGWGKVVGGVVGKIWEFGTAVFRGFHAGGGQKYSVSNANIAESYRFVEDTAGSASFWETEKQQQPTSFWGDERDRESTPVPGRFPDEDFIPDYMDQHSTTTPSKDRPAKRRQVSRNNTVDESLNKNWVMVKPPPDTYTYTPTPSKPQPRGPARYSMPTTASSGRRSTAATSRPQASRAGFRPQASRVSHAGSPALNPRHAASFASPRPSPNSPSRIPRPGISGGAAGGAGTGTGTPLSPAAREAQRWALKKKAEEREADESIRRLDRQLKAMIREGKEALGTRVSVELEGGGEGEGGAFGGGGTRKWDF